MESSVWQRDMVNECSGNKGLEAGVLGLGFYSAKFGVQWGTKKVFQQGMASSLN